MLMRGLTLIVIKSIISLRLALKKYPKHFRCYDSKQEGDTKLCVRIFQRDDHILTGGCQPSIRFQLFCLREVKSETRVGVFFFLIKNKAFCLSPKSACVNRFWLWVVKKKFKISLLTDH